MFKNYFKVAIRSLIKQKFYSAINISGLAVGAMACILILLFVQDELSYDKFYQKSDRIYRVTQILPMGAKVYHTATAPWPLTQNLLTDFSEIEVGAKAYRPSSWGNLPVVRYEDISFVEEMGMLEMNPSTIPCNHQDIRSALMPMMKPSSCG